MKSSKFTAVLLTLVLVFLNLAVLANAEPAPESYITLELDKTTAKVGEMIQGAIKIKNIKNFASFQVVIKYDPNILQAVNPKTGEAYTRSTVPSDGDVIANEKYQIVPIASNDTASGIINFGKTYVSMSDYKTSGKPETTGTLGVIGFKVLKDGPATIKFADVKTLPGAISGTMLFDWDQKKVTTGYSVIQPKGINGGATEKTVVADAVKQEPLVNNSQSSNNGSNDQPSTANNQQNTQPQNPVEETKSSNNMLVIIVIAVIVLLLGIIALNAYVKRIKKS